MTTIMPTSVKALTSMPSSAEATKSWMASMSLVTLRIKLPVRTMHRIHRQSPSR